MFIPPPPFVFVPPPPVNGMPIAAAQGEEKRSPYLQRELRILAVVTAFAVLALLGLLAALPWLW